jgi:cytokinin dehydrogenase
MQRNISRRDFGKRLAGGAVLLALQPAWNYPAAAQSLRNDLKDLSGELSFDEAVLQTAADDFGRVVHKKPIAVLRPGDAQDIAKLVQFANRQGLKVAMRGQGHSFFGQTQVAGGVVVDSSSLNAVRIVKSGAGGTAEVGPGSKWHPVLMAANAQKLTVPVIADTFLSVGGTISTGGFGVTSYNLGLQVDHVQELEVVTGDGQIVTCSDARNSDLFNAMLGGVGQCGIITKVVMRLMAAPTHVLFIKMDYDDFQSASADLALLAKDGRFHHLDGRGAARPTGGVGYYVEGGAFYDAPFQLSRTLPAGTDTSSMITLNRTLYERARDMGGYRMTSSAVEMSQDDWKRHYGPVWQIVQAAKTKFDPRNVLTPGHGMFPS